MPERQNYEKIYTTKTGNKVIIGKKIPSYQNNNQNNFATALLQ